MKVSALVLTLNEEANLANCLRSLSWCDDVVVLDSYSSDATEQIARAAGARFHQRAFDNYAAHRNFALRELEYRHPWLLMVDADEAVPEEMVREIETTLAECDEDVCLFRFRRKDYFMGRWIKRSSGYPTWFGRLVRLGRVWVEREVNEEYLTDGTVRKLQSHLLHYPFNKGFAAWLEKHNRYSSMEAQALLQRETAYTVSWRGAFSRDPQTRRKTAKQLFYVMPGRPLLAFLGLYLVRGGILEGRAGFTFCMLRSIYEYMINCKRTELRRRQAGEGL